VHLAPAKLATKVTSIFRFDWYDRRSLKSLVTINSSPRSRHHRHNTNFQSPFDTAAGRIRGRRFAIVSATLN
jgi:hypothetical protein